MIILIIINYEFNLVILQILIYFIKFLNSVNFILDFSILILIELIIFIHIIKLMHYFLISIIKFHQIIFKILFLMNFFN